MFVPNIEVRCCGAGCGLLVGPLGCKVDAHGLEIRNDACYIACDNHYVCRWHDLVVENVDDIAVMMTMECGKPLAESKAECVGGCALASDILSLHFAVISPSQPAAISML